MKSFLKSFLTECHSCVSKVESLLRDGTQLCDETHVFDRRMVSCHTTDPNPDI